MNIIDVQDQLKNFSEQQLISEMQMPSGSAPQFLVLSEIKRRKRVRDDFMKREAANQPTVAEEAIAAAGVPQSGIMGMSEAMAPQAAVAEGGIGSVMPQSMRPQKMPAPTDDAIPMRSGGLAQFGQELSGKVSEGVEPFLDEVEGMAQDRFGVDVSGPLQGGIADLSRPPYEIARPTQDFMGRIPPFMRQPGFSARPAVLPAFPIRRGGKGGPRFSNMMVPTSELGLAQRQDRAFAEGGVVRAANGLPLGLRQNNPGNIRPGAGFYGETGQGGGYAEFGSEDEGLRALARLLGTYSDEYGINTLRGLTSRYAPRSDNEESFDNYISYLGETLGMDPDEEFDLKGRRDDIIPAIVGFEQGRDYGDRYSDDQVARAIRAAGTEDEAEIAEILAGGSEPNLASRALSAVGEAVFPSAEASGPAMRDVGTPQEEFDRVQAGKQGPFEYLGGLLGIGDPEPYEMGGRQRGAEDTYQTGLAERKSTLLDMIKSLPTTIAATNFYGENKQEIDADPDLKAAIDAIIDPSSVAVATLEDFQAENEVILPNNTVVAAGETIPAGTVMPSKQAEDLNVAAKGTGSTVGSIDEEDSDFTSMYPFIPPGLLDDSNVPVLPKSAEVQQNEVAAAGATLPETSDRGSGSGEGSQTDGDSAAETEGRTSEGTTQPNVSYSNNLGATGASSSLQQEILDLQKKLERDRDTDKYLALAQAGLALMSSKDPTLLGAIGEAGVSGLSAYREAQDRYNEGVVDLINARAKLNKGSDKDAFDAGNAVTRLGQIERALGGADGMTLPEEDRAKLLQERLFLRRFIGIPELTTGATSAAPAS